ncbi:MAG: glycosyltransferase family 9 protein, partial [Pseudomonadota bacterium]
DYYIALAPSAAWPMKRWPLEHWKVLLALLPDLNLILLGGPSDQFCEELAKLRPGRIINTAGKLTLLESCAAIAQSQLLVSADTGHLHVGDYLGIKTLALLGPTAFGHPTNPQVKVLEVDMPCRPCTKDGRGKCSQQIYQECLVRITPSVVAQEIRSFLL